MKRAKHSLSHYRLFTCDMGQLVPIGLYEVLPGDSVQQATSVLLRVSPLLAPVMHPVTVRVHHWFIPNRLLWTGWEEFITGGPDGEGGSSGTPPTVTANASGFQNGGLLDYMGVPPGVANISVSALPVRAYNKVFNEYYRDEDLVTALTVPTGNGADTTSPRTVQNIAWEKDYFTSARPWPQKGPDVTLPLGTEAPVHGLGKVTSGYNSPAPASFIERDGSHMYANYQVIDPNVANAVFAVEQDPNNPGRPNIYADLSTATAATVNELREAMAIQRYQEARARYGDRYTEYLAYLGVRSSDARLQRPEYLGGAKQTISFTEVLQTGPDSSDDGVADLKGHGISAMRSRRFRRFFEEHGLVMTLLSVRPRTMYVNGVHKMWSRTTKEDYWQKELQHIGAQEVHLSEVWANAAVAGNTSVFGYQDRYAEYRHVPSGVSGEFRSSALNFWHLARIFAAQPGLNSSFVSCDPSPRIFASQATDGLWCMASHSVQARRLVDRSAAGRIY